MNLKLLKDENRIYLRFNSGASIASSPISNTRHPASNINIILQLPFPLPLFKNNVAWNSGFTNSVEVLL